MNMTSRMCYLKHIGALQNAKVTIVCTGRGVEIHIHDFVFYTFKSALDYLRRDAESIAEHDGEAI